MEIQRSIQQRSGRFLSPQANGWTMVSNATARQKIAHSLQYRQRCLLKHGNLPLASDAGENPSQARSNQFDLAQSTVSNPEEEVNIGIPGPDSSLEQIYSREHTFSTKVPQHSSDSDEVASEIAQFMASTEKYGSSSFQPVSSYSSNHSVKSLEAQFDHRRTYSGHDLSSYHWTADASEYGPFTKSAPSNETTEPQINYRYTSKHSDHQSVTHHKKDNGSGEGLYSHIFQGSIPESEMDYRKNAYQYYYPLPSSYPYPASAAIDEDRKMPSTLDALDLSGVHSLTTFLSRQESAEYTFMSYPAPSARKNSETIDILDDDIIRMPPKSGSDDSLVSIFSKKGPPAHRKSL